MVAASFIYFAASGIGQRVEQQVLDAVNAGGADQWRFVALVNDIPPRVWVLVTAALVAIVVVVRRVWIEGILALLAALAANLAAQYLKHNVFVRPDTGLDWTGPASLPSGHTTLAASCAAALLLVVPAWARGPLAIIGAGWTAAVGLGTIAAGWHRPADIVAAIAVVTCSFALAIAVRPPTKPGIRETNDGTSLILPLVAVLGGALAVGIAIMEIFQLRSGQVDPPATLLISVVVGILGSGGIAFASLAMLAGTQQVRLAPSPLIPRRTATGVSAPPVATGEDSVSPPTYGLHHSSSDVDEVTNPTQTP